MWKSFWNKICVPAVQSFHDHYIIIRANYLYVFVYLSIQLFLVGVIQHDSNEQNDLYELLLI